MAPRTVRREYTPEIAARIADHYVSGLSLKKISEQDGMPCYSTILRWHHEYREFQKMIENAAITRARHFEEVALEAGLSFPDKNDEPGARLAFNASVWAAGVNDPGKYGKKTQISGDAKNPVIIQVVTGVSPPDHTPKDIKGDVVFQIMEEKENGRE
jgi:hypothetical protein